MATIVLFHSVLGLRQIERSALARLEASGHVAFAPDLFGGRTAATPDEGFTIMDEIGWDLICSRARLALDHVPPGAVLAGFSMGAGVVSAVWPERAEAGAVLLLHGLADVPRSVPQLVERMSMRSRVRRSTKYLSRFGNTVSSKLDPRIAAELTLNGSRGWRRLIR